MRQKLLQLAESKKVIGVNFNASAGGKLVSASGTITEVGDDYIVMQDIYGNAMLVPVVAIAYIEIKR